MADSPNTAVEFFSQRLRELDPALAPDLPDLSRLSMTELDILSEFHRAIAEAARHLANQPRCTPAIERMIGETQTRAWHFVIAIAEEAASRKPEAESDDEMIRAQITLHALFDREDLDLMILHLADEIRAGRPTAAQ